MVVGVLMAAGMDVGTASAEPYRIMTNSPVHTTAAGNEAVLVYGEAPSARWVEITINGQTYSEPVRDGAFHMTVPPPAPGTYGVTGIWGSETLELVGEEWVETATTGHLVDGILTILGRGFGEVPAGTVTISQGAYLEGCTGCVDHTTNTIEAGGYVLVSNADTERHQFTTRTIWAVESTGNLDPGESVRLPFNSQGEAHYRCIYHPWLEFTIRSTGQYAPAEVGGALILETPDHAGDSVRVGITHTGDAAVAHVVFIQAGQVLAAGTAPLTDGYGVFTVDAADWLVGEVIISVSAGADHTTGTISVRPPPGAAERSGMITGYEGPDGILINSGLARPAGIIPLDAASEATRQVCMVGQEALFRGDTGLAPRGSHYSEGTVWCDGVNLGVYLLESGLAITDPAECGLARAEWLAPYCFPPQDTQPILVGPPAIQDGPVVDIPAESASGQDDPAGGAQSGVLDTGDEPPKEPAGEPDGDSLLVIPDDIPAVPDPVTIAEPDLPPTEAICDHLVDPTCPCPEGWVRNGDWCDPDFTAGFDAAAEAGGQAAEDVGGMITGTAGDLREDAVDTLGGFFGWAYEGLANIPRFFTELGAWIIDQWVF